MPSRSAITGHSLRRGATGVWMLALIALTGAGGYWWWRAGQTADTDTLPSDALLHTVEREDFSLEITERGEIQSAGGVEVKSEVKSQNSAGIAILRIVPEGTQVEEGDFLVQLDSSALESDRLLQQINVNTAEALVIEAQNLYETAIIAQKEYLEGLFVQERQTIESEVFVAEENLSRAEEYVEYSRKLAAKGYVSDLQLQADMFAVEKSKKELDAAKTKLRVLEDFTKAKTLKQLSSDAAIAKAKWESLKNSYQLEIDKLTEIEDQIAKCLVTAPAPGAVIYAHGEENRGGNEFVVEEGAVIRERQTIIRLPDISSMQVEVEVNESLIQYVQEGMPAAIRLVGATDEVLRGRVARVNQYAEPTNWRRANVKDYKAFVAIEEDSSVLKTGMTASVTISAMYAPDSIVAPVQSIYAHGDRLYCFVQEDQGFLAREVSVGPTNDRFYVIESGLASDETIALNPRKLSDRVELPELVPEENQNAVDSGGDWRKLRREEVKQPSGATAAKPADAAVAGQG
ncbi:macrolide transporter subunit MacA [Planctomycetes bacterium MalM25]|nr:macrolide transporter subunit MacA [Planctomycetes bacterium MalM25]